MRNYYGFGPGTMVFLAHNGRLRRLTPETVRADEVRYRQEAAADRREFERALGLSPWTRHLRK